MARRTTCALAVGALAWAPAAPAQAGPSGAAGTAGTAAGSTSGAPATDDGDDLKDELVDHVAPYRLMPEGDPLRGRSGPIDWDELGPLAGLDTESLPEDLRTYVNTFVGLDAGALVMGMQADDLDPDLLIGVMESGFGTADGEPVTLPRAEAAHLPYTAFEVSPPDLPAGVDVTVEMAMLADDDIAVMLMVQPFDFEIDEPGEAERLQADLDEFVNAQATFVPTAGSSDDRVGSGGIHRNRVDGSDGGDSSEWPLRRVGAITSVALLTLGALLLMRYLWLRRHAPPAPVAPGGWPQAFPPTTPTGYGPPLPGLGGRPARVQYPASPPYARTPPAAPAAPVALAAPVAPVPPGGFRAGRGGTPLPPTGAPPAQPGAWRTMPLGPPGPAAPPGAPPATETSAPTGDGWTRPG